MRFYIAVMVKNNRVLEKDAGVFWLFDLGKMQVRPRDSMMCLVTYRW